VEGPVFDVKDVTCEAALGRNREEFEGKQDINPWMQIGAASRGHQILPIRSPLIESAGEPTIQPGASPRGMRPGIGCFSSWPRRGRNNPARGNAPGAEALSRIES
jgi:hypothetical protein